MDVGAEVEVADVVTVGDAVAAHAVTIPIPSTTAIRTTTRLTMTT